MSSNRVGPIIFADETARTQLLDEGEVITFRASQRTTGDTHARWERTGSKQCDVHVTEVGQVNPTPEALRPYRPLSGFETVEAWRDAIADLNGDVPDGGYLYRATLRSSPAEES